MLWQVMDELVLPLINRSALFHMIILILMTAQNGSTALPQHSLRSKILQNPMFATSAERLEMSGSALARIEAESPSLSNVT